MCIIDGAFRSAKMSQRVVDTLLQLLQTRLSQMKRLSSDLLVSLVADLASKSRNSLSSGEVFVVWLMLAIAQLESSALRGDCLRLEKIKPDSVSTSFSCLTPCNNLGQILFCPWMMMRRSTCNLCLTLFTNTSSRWSTRVEPTS